MDPQSLIILAVVGLVAGFLANALIGGRGNLLKYLVLGVIGAFVGGALQRYVGIPVNLGSALVDQIVVATVGALVVAFLARLLG